MRSTVFFACLLALVAFAPLASAQSQDENVCELCEFVLATAERYLSQNSTEQQIEKFLDDVCNVLPSQYRSQCNAFVQEYLPTIIEAIENGESPSEACGQMELCSTTTSSTNEEEPEEEDADMCELCEFLISTAETYLADNATLQEIESFVENLCDILPQYSSMCTVFIEDYFPMAVQYFLTHENPSIACAQVGACSATSEEVEEEEEEEVGAEMCEICEFAVSYAENFLAQNSTEEEVASFLEDICNVLPGEYSSICSSFIEDYLPEVIAYIETNETPEVACTQVGACTGTSTASEEEMVRIEKMPEDDTCDLCEFLVATAERYLSNNATTEEVEELVEKICDALPSEYASMCNVFVQEYLPLAIQYILDDETPAVACQEVGACTATSTGTQEMAEEEDLCPMCEFAVSYVEDYLEKDSTQEEITEALQGVCDVLPSTFSSLCDEFVDEYLPLVFQFLANNEDPEDVCTQLGICSSAVDAGRQHHRRHHHSEGHRRHHHHHHSEGHRRHHHHHQNQEQLNHRRHHHRHQNQMAVDQAGECELCEFIISTAENYLSENSTEAEIEQFVENICAVLPAEYKSMCDLFVDQYLPYAIQYILDDETPSVACGELGLCSTTSGSAPPSMEEDEEELVASSSSSDDGNVCQLCQAIVSGGESLFKSGMTKSQFKKGLEKLCVVIPVDGCKAYIDENIDALYDAVENADDPVESCRNLGACM